MANKASFFRRPKSKEAPEVCFRAACKRLFKLPIITPALRNVILGVLWTGDHQRGRVHRSAVAALCGISQSYLRQLLRQLDEILQIPKRTKDDLCGSASRWYNFGTWRGRHGCWLPSSWCGRRLISMLCEKLLGVSIGIFVGELTPRELQRAKPFKSDPSLLREFKERMRYMGWLKDTQWAAAKTGGFSLSVLDKGGVVCA